MKADMRVFVPVTEVSVAALLRDRELGPAPLVGYAVTSALRESYRDGDTEELEYAALTQAARACLLLLAGEQQAVGDTQSRRMVLAVDAEDVRPDPGSDDEPGRVRVDRPVPLGRVAAAHVDTPDAASAVAAAVAMLRAGGPRNSDERFLLDECEGHELAWFVTQELAGLLS